MKREKTFDCVRMKDEIQASLRRERRGMSPVAVRRSIERKLATSDSPTAKLWRRLSREQKVSTGRRSVPAGMA